MKHYYTDMNVGSSPVFIWGCVVVDDGQLWFRRKGTIHHFLCGSTSHAKLSAEGWTKMTRREFFDHYLTRYL